MNKEGNNLRQLKYKKSNIKAQVTSFLNFLHDCEKLESHDIDLITFKLSKIEPLYDTFVEIYQEIEFNQSDDQNDAISDMQELDLFQETFCSVINLAKKLLNINQSLNRSGTASHEPAQSTVNSNIKLPELSLPTFDGNFARWNEFIDNFTAVIHDNVNISDAQKLCYLKRSVCGEAAELLAPFIQTNANYTIALQLLKNKYDNKRKIIYSHVQAILEIPVNTKENYLALNTLINTVERHLLSLKTLEIPTASWDALIIPILSAKLDPITARAWQLKINTELKTSEIPTYNYFIEFLKTQLGTLDAVKSQNIIQKNMYTNNISCNPHKTHSKNFALTKAVTCKYCKAEHLLYACEKFKSLSPVQRHEKIKNLQLCLNCLNKGHTTMQCKSLTSCKICRRRHHTLLHFERTLTDKEGPQTVPSEDNIENINAQSTSLTSSLPSGTQVLLSTALVHVYDNSGNKYTARALLDSGSQSNFISIDLCKKLRLPFKRINTTVYGIGASSSNIYSQLNLRCKSMQNNFEKTLSFLTIPTISENIPNRSFNKSSVNIPPNINLADPNFHLNSKVDILLGAEIFWEVLCVGRISLNSGLILQKTLLGWVVAGNLNIPNEKLIKQALTSISLLSLHDQVAQFWEEDEFPNKLTHYTIEEQFCENHFKNNTTRNECGRYIVRIPFKINPTQLGNSYDTALKRFYLLERKLASKPDFQKRYTEFINEYEQLGHMSRINTNLKSGYFLPHHAVIKENNLTTKIRVVFDGSLKTDTNLSLNDIQCVGPTVQTDLFSLILRFRTHAYALTADIAQMYRQILIHNDDRKYQKIIWRNKNTSNLNVYQLNTVTYGTSSAPYLATRVLRELGVQNEVKFQLESNIIKNDFYVDDMLTGANSISELITIRNNVQTILQQAGFILRKWNSNCKDLVLFNDDSLESNNTVTISQETSKTLGIQWNTTCDTFTYTLNNIKDNKYATKRTILSTSSQLFDPLGLLAPILINSKFLIQEIWQLNLTWDEAVPMHIYSKWNKFKSELINIAKISIPRYVLNNDTFTIEIHGYSDASEKGYGACVYARVITKNLEITSNLLTAKSRVAPIKKSTLPRLELCAAVLLAQLVRKVTESIKFKIHNIYYWCDSTIALCWIKSSPSRWNTYVANRVSEIQRLSNIDNWNHVISNDNPADLISRGTTPSVLINSELWWKGPSWLYTEKKIPFTQIGEFPKIIPEHKTNALNTTTANHLNLFARYSDLNKLINVISYCFRFGLKSNQYKGIISAEEKRETLLKLIRLAQFEIFETEINCLKNKLPLQKKSKLIQLNPIFDNNNILRVGGRLMHSKLNYDSKHQIILPKNHHLTNLIASDTHKRLLHCGAQNLLFHLREKYWPIGGMLLTKHIVHKCVRCYRVKPKPISIFMGNLPKERIEQSLPFEFCGVDYAGPISLKESRSKKSKLLKAYISIFVCFSTKAMHLELVSDLTSESFIAALRRFCSRRGKPSTIYSDNGTNFVGANRELKQMLEISQTNKVAEHVALEGISWKFIPPRSPHVGGLWEAGVKSVKTILKKVLGNSLLNFESMCTVLTQIEASLNSRPISPLSNDPSDLNSLTPAHFLIGRKYISIADPSMEQIPDNRLSNYQRLQALHQHFWKRWHREYLNQLQTRYKWNHNEKDNVKRGDMVLLIDDKMPPSTWRLGRISELYAGKDNKVRIVSVRTTNGDTKRTLNKLSRLPINH